MTEAEWQACEDPAAMLRQVGSTPSVRKLRLFLIATARTAWDRMTDARMRDVVLTAERCVEGEAQEEQLQIAKHDLIASVMGGSMHEKAEAMGVTFEVWGSLRGLAHCCGLSSQGLQMLTRLNCWRDGTEVAGTTQPSLLREVIGNPFRAPAFDAARLTPTIAALALAAYDERSLPSGELDVVRLSILADALTDAGCTDDALLSHLRSPGPHVRGCWALDLILGKD
jgi:hypothetical protein